MSTQYTGSESRREVLQKSLKPETSGGFTTLAAKMMVEPLGGKPAECTLVGHCRTFVFEFPGSHLVVEEPVGYQIIYSEGSRRAAITFDLPAYFGKEPADSVHHDIDVSLRAGIRKTYEKTLNPDGTSNKLFLVIEEYSNFPPTELNTKQCFTIDEVRDGREMIEGGREGKRALVALPAKGCPWPYFHPDTRHVNVILTAVKAVQNYTGHIRQLYECSCFVSSERTAVFIVRLTMSASLQTALPLTLPELEERAGRMRSMLRAMTSDSDPVAAELFDSIVLDNTKDDSYLRLSYLRLWQAAEDARRHLNHAELSNDGTLISGNRTPKELKAYRNDIAHWHTGRIDHKYLDDLQYTVMELLRRKYGGNPQSDA